MLINHNHADGEPCVPRCSEPWVTVFTAANRGQPGFAACAREFDRQYRGKVAIPDSRVLNPVPPEFPQLQLRESVQRGLTG